jgi:hypothetical protein
MVFFIILIVWLSSNVRIYSKLTTTSISEKVILPKFGGYIGIINLFLSKSKLALPYICLLIIFSLFTFPSTGPLLQGKVISFSIEW